MVVANKTFSIPAFTFKFQIRVHPERLKRERIPVKHYLKKENKLTQEEFKKVKPKSYSVL